MDRRTAAIHADAPRFARAQLFDGARACIEQLQSHAPQFQRRDGARKAKNGRAGDCNCPTTDTTTTLKRMRRKIVIAEWKQPSESIAVCAEPARRSGFRRVLSSDPVEGVTRGPSH
jgi:hypothetical protein